MKIHDNVDFSDPILSKSWASLVKRILNIEDWHEVGDTNEPAFENSWVNYDTTRKARFYKHLDRAYLAGRVKLGTINTPIFTLPSEYIPDYLDATNQTAVFSGSSNSLYTTIVVNYLGEVICTNGSNVWVSLDGISFRI